MTTKKRLGLILILFTVTFCTAAFILERIVSKKVNTLKAEKLANACDNVNQLLSLHSNGLQVFVESKAKSDELYEAIKNKNWKWIEDNSLGDTKNYNLEANQVLVLDSNFNTLYEKHSIQTESLVDDIKPLKNKIIKLNEVHHTKHITFKTANKNFFDGCLATVTTGGGAIQKNIPNAYLLVGEIITPNHLHELKKLNKDFTYSIVDNQQKIALKDKVEGNEFICFKEIPSLNSSSLTLKVSATFPETSASLKFVRIALILFLIFVALVIGLILNHFYKNYFNPLEKVTTALEQENAQPLESIKNTDTEFGKVAKLIELYFKQNQEYQTLLNARIEADLELKWAVEQIENATIAKVRAEQSAGAKSEFLATMSHEIRTPINGVIGVANLLKEEDLTPRQKEYVDILTYSSKHLLALVSDILDFSKIETGKIEFEKSSFDLHGICESIYSVFKISADNKKLDLIFNPDKTLTHSVYGDSVRTNQILTNLVSNAIKFTSKGNVTFSYKLIAQTTNTCTVEFSVKDTGIGIAEAEQTKVFEGFSQANSSITKNFGGTGLGLSISKKLVELQGGKLNVKSLLGEGSEFSFYLTFETNAYENKEPESLKITTLKRETLDGMKVLVAEDNSINILVLKRFLEKWNVQYKLAINGKLALEILENESFDLVLMDIHMPEMDGEQATKLIRENTNEKIKNMPIVALTANASLDVQQRLLSEGFSSYISKPFNPDNLFRILKKYYFEG
jgi:signal transduction histidine kinase/ActR/RegA family two-component response regulator